MRQFDRSLARSSSSKSWVKRDSDRNAWVISWGLTLALHLAGFLGLPGLRLSAPAPVAIRRPEPIRLVFKGSRPETRGAERPRLFSEQPPDRADAAPEVPDFLSNVTSRARDLVPGGDGALPRMEGDGDAPMVKLESSGNPSSPLSMTPQLTQPLIPQSAEVYPGSGPAPQPQTETSEDRATSPKPQEPDLPRPMSDVAFLGTARSAGNSDIDQPAMDRPHGNAELTGEVSLNTTAWNYAPWLQRFGRNVMRWWIAPPAYYMGILKEGGWAVVELEISRSGKVLRHELLEEHGHPSLIRAAEAALHAPIEPLPADFPEPALILRIRMVYPRIRPR